MGHFPGLHSIAKSEFRTQLKFRFGSDACEDGLSGKLIREEAVVKDTNGIACAQIRALDGRTR